MSENSIIGSSAFFEALQNKSTSFSGNSGLEPRAVPAFYITVVISRTNYSQSTAPPGYISNLSEISRSLVLVRLPIMSSLPGSSAQMFSVSMSSFLRLFFIAAAALLLFLLGIGLPSESSPSSSSPPPNSILTGQSRLSLGQIINPF